MAGKAGVDAVCRGVGGRRRGGDPLTVKEMVAIRIGQLGGGNNSGKTVAAPAIAVVGAGIPSHVPIACILTADHNGADVSGIG